MDVCSSALSTDGTFDCEHALQGNTYCIEVHTDTFTFINGIVAVLAMNPVGRRSDSLASCVYTAETLIRMTCLSDNPSPTFGPQSAGTSDIHTVAALRFSGLEPPLERRALEFMRASGCGLNGVQPLQRVGFIDRICALMMSTTMRPSTAAGGMSRVLTSQYNTVVSVQVRCMLKNSEMKSRMCRTNNSGSLVARHA